FFSQVVWAALGGSVGPSIITALIGEIDPSAPAKLMSGIGGVDSADIANQIFKLSRQVRASDELSSAFDAGLSGLLEKVAASGSQDAKRFTASVDAFMYVHGSRGPNEWDPYAWSYESNPMLLLQGINIARTASDDADPERTLATASAERQRLIEHF